LSSAPLLIHQMPLSNIFSGDPHVAFALPPPLKQDKAKPENNKIKIKILNVNFFLVDGFFVFDFIGFDYLLFTKH
ncbi:MAG: hypothetical protein CVU88_06235, partial [Firmicutes bacterium HGW-Firmicutes-13]